MKARYKALGGRLEFELEGATAKELFGSIASIQEVFEAEHACGICGSKDVRFVVRESEGKRNGKTQNFTYYELRCMALTDGRTCGARFDFGQSLDTENLFPKRKTPEGEWMPNRGWYKYTPNGREHSGPAMSGDPAPEVQNATRQGSAATAPGAATTNAYGGKVLSMGEHTPEGLQPSFDRLGAIFNKTAPTRWSFALDMVRDALHHAAGKAGTDEFDRMYRVFQQQYKDGYDAQACKGLLAALMSSYGEVVRSA